MIHKLPTYTLILSLLATSALAEITSTPSHKPLKPRVEANWRHSNDRSILMTEFWVPIAQNEIDGSVVYGDLRLMGDNTSNREFNIGAGYRKMVKTTLLGEGITGAHIWYDRRFTKRGSKFNQMTAGMEWFGDIWDTKLNAYMPLNDSKNHTQSNPNGSGAHFAGNQIVVNTDQSVVEEALPGLDLELGWKVSFLDDFTDSTRVYAGAYHFQGDKADNVTGWRARITSDITSDVQIGARFQRDDERGSQAFVEATIRFPFGSKQSYKQKGLRARLDESPERDIDIVSGEAVTDQGIGETLLNAVTGDIQNVIHVDNTAAGGGDGSVETPFNTLAAAEGAATTNDLIYLHRGDGTTAGQNAGITLDDEGQMLVGAGSNLTYNSGRFSTSNGLGLSDTLLISADPLGAPVITNGAGDGVRMLKNNTFLAGLTVDGTTQDGIVVEADGVGTSATNVSITDVSAINNRFGIYIHGANSGDVSAKVQGSVTTANSQHGMVVYDDTSGTFTADLGGGALGSSGNNVLAGNTLEDLAVEYDGGTLSAKNNWWGQATGADTDDPSIGIAPQIYYGAPINDGLVGHWTFDSEWMSGVTAYDRSGNGNDGTLSGQQGLPTITTGNFGESLLFLGDPDGNGNLQGTYVRIPTAPELNPTDDITLLAFGQKPIGPGEFSVLRATGSEYDITVNPTLVRLAINSDFVGSRFAGYNDDGSWNFLAGTYDRITRRVYVDAVEIGNSPLAIAINDNNSAIHIGARNDLFANYWTGSIDDVRIYNRALGVSEIAEVYRMDASSTVNASGFLTSAP